MTVFAASPWKRLTTLMSLGAVAYGGMIALDIVATDAAAPQGGQTLAIFSTAQASPHGAPSDGPFKLGRIATEDEIAAWDIDIRPDGQGLPDGEGSVTMGEEVYQEQCAVCHGVFGEAEGRWPVLAGGEDTLASDDPVKTVGSYWPYLSTVYDYVHRAMPFGNAQSLSDDEVYAITAYILYLNDLVDEDFTLSKANFAETRLPNEPNFFPDDRLESPIALKKEACMTDCKESVEITARAMVIDVTPEEETAAATEGAAGEVVEASAETPAEEAAPAPAVAAIDPALAEAGEKVFRKCKACHQVGDGAKHRQGPILNGVVGRAAGAAEGFTKYSKAMKAAAEGGLVWTEEALAEFLAKPRKYMKGTSMGFAGLKKEEDVKAVVAYIQSASP